MPEPFAKIFDLPGGYQLLVQRENSEDTERPYHCSYTTHSAEGVKIRLSGGYETSEQAERRFKAITAEDAAKMTRSVLRMLNKEFEFPAA